MTQQPEPVAPATRRATVFAAVVLVAATATTVAGLFTLTAHGNYGYGKRLMLLGDFSWAVPAALDVLQVVAIAAAFVMAGAPTSTRRYAWTVFAVANGASIAANLGDAQARHLPWQGWVGAGALPVLLSLGVHLAVVTWRHWATARTVATPATRDKARRDTAGGDAPTGDTTGEQRPSRQRAPRARTPKRGSRGNATDPMRDNARAMAGDGKSVTEILIGLGLPATPANRRKVERMTQDLRQPRQQRQPA